LSGKGTTVGIFGKSKGAPSGSVDPALPDGEWLLASEALFRQRIDDFYGSPETMARGGEEHQGLSDHGTAMFFYAKSIDMLHTAYGFAEMAQRQPSAADLPIVNGFTTSLRSALDSHPEAPVVDCVREVTHRLRSISSECDRVGLPSDLYRSGLESLARSAPHVPVDDVRWT
jgi:hypothetical protein